MKRTLALVTALAVVLAVGAMAQGKTDFSGNWKRDATKSDAPQMGRGGPGGGAPMGDVTLAIAQTAADITMERKMGENVQKSTYKLDGSESVSTSPRGGDIKSKAKWDGANLVIESTQTMSMGGNEMTITSKEIWSLGADGAITVVTTRTTPRGEMTTRTVYTKITG
jgi:hypothetical protein